MLQLYDLNKVKIAGLKNYKDYCIESNLSNGDKKLSFLYPLKMSNEIVAEGYIRTKTDEFVIKELGTAGEWKTIKADLNVEDLEGNVFEHFDTTNKTINESLTLALAGTGWIVGTCNVTRRRTVRKTNSSTWEIIQEAKKNYRAEIEFDTLNKKINIFERCGTDKGTYFIESLNLKDLDVQSNSYDFYTRIIAIGKDDLRVTLENYQYSSKKKTFIWVDDRYTDINALTEDAMAKLNELSKPYRAYSANVIDLASMNIEYKDILNYKLGDTITLISKDKEIKEKQRIVKIVEYPEEPERNTCEIANTTLKFEDLQKEFQDTSNTVNNITVDDGTIDGNAINGISSKKIYDLEANVVRITDLTAVNAKIEHLYADKADIGSLNAVIANIGILNVTKANITDLKAINASITDLKADKANILDLKATNARVNVLEADTGNIQTLLAGNLTSTNIQSLNLTSDKVTVANGFIKNAMIDTVDVSKINAGIINTNKFTIKSADGGIEIVGATQQFKDKNGKVRIQMGKDTQGNFNFILRGEDGVTALIDHTGIKKDAIANDLIVKEMIGADAIGEKQLDYSSFAEGFNKDTNTTTLKATKIKLDNQNQTLDLAFNGLKSQADGTKNLTESHTTSIGVQQGKIDTLISDTSIVKDGVTTKLKDEYSKTVATVNSSVETIGKHTTLLDAHTGDIKKVTTDVVEVNKSLDGITTRVGSSETSIDGINKSVSTANNEILQLKTTISLKVCQTNIDTAITNIVVGGRNLIRNSSKPVTTNSWSGAIIRNSILLDENTFIITNTSSTSEKYASTQRCKLEGGKEYTFSIKVFLETNVDSIDVFFLMRKKDSIKDWDYAPQFINMYKSIKGEWITLTATMKIPIDVYDGYIRIDNNKANGPTGNTLWFTNIKLEEGNKATSYVSAPEDVDQQIADTITINTTNINQAKAEILLETNAIKLAVSSVDSTVTATTKTANSALTNAGTATTAAQKAATAAKNAQDGVESISGSVRNLKDSTEKTISITNNKLADVAIELNGITSRVSAEEKKSTSIDNKVIAQDTRLKAAELKITDSAIISTVQATITTAKTDAINSANASTDGKLNAYSNTSAMTSAINQSANSIKQEVSNTYITTGNANNTFATKGSVVLTDSEWRATFKSSGGYNLIPNGKALLNTNGWRNNGGTRFNREYYEMGSAFAMSMPNGINFEGWIKLERGVDYVYSAKFYSDVAGSGSASTPLHFWVGTSEANNSFVTVIDHNQGTILARWQDLYVHFITRPDVDTFFKPFIYGGPTTAVASITNIMLAKGTMVTPWVPNSNEVYSGNTSIDSGGVTIYNGAIRVLDGAGNEVLKGDASGISFSGRLQPRDNQIKLFGENCKIDASGGALRMQLNPYDYVLIDTAYTRFFNGNSNNGTNFVSLGVDGQGHTSLFGKTTMLKLLGSGTPSVQARWAGDGGYCMIQASSFTVSSSEVFKENIMSPDTVNFKDILMSSTIKEYNLKKDLEQIEKMPTVLLPNGENPIKADVKIGVILEELSEDGRAFMHPSSSDGIDLYSMCSILWKNVQNQQLTIEELNKKLEQLLK
ncbi:phage tail spike protein [Clostridium gasigenes]|uniref:Phage minor structural protein, N-terminal region n=1 Tax=Clostridium gasigenes TaxID=94869 RepID=A0A1H0N6V9_9CLOT|nr:phage tail spike protein [Clostridium gasigenes]SDO88424.1 phage minor structural protein, N-terminal region [Clostridium gasigenes]